MRLCERPLLSKHTCCALAVASFSGLSVAPPATARVIPVAQVDPEGNGVVQRLTDRHMVLIDIDYRQAGNTWIFRLVVHDSRGEEPPRDVTPAGFSVIGAAGAREEPDGTLRILAYGRAPSGGGDKFVYSGDGGVTWTPIAWPAALRGLRVGTAEVPFVAAIFTSGVASFRAIRADGSTYLLSNAYNNGLLLGSDIAGTRFLVSATRFEWPPPSAPYEMARKIAILDLAGNIQTLTSVVELTLEGWITPQGTAYFNGEWWALHSYSAFYWDGRNLNELARAKYPFAPVAAPMADYSGAWIASQEGNATVFRSHTGTGGLVERWRVTAMSYVKDVFSGSSGERILISARSYASGASVETRRLAIWEVGGPPPSAWDEVFLDREGSYFVHLDVDASAEGAPFFINATNPPAGGFPGGLPPEWPRPLGIVRASFRQQLVIPAAARIGGMSGAEWRTDLLVRNPETSPVLVAARFLPNPQTSVPVADATFTIGAGSIAVIPDALSSLFHLDRGSGAIVLTPEGNRGILATSRTYTRAASGTYGMSVDAVDVQSAAKASFPLTFSAALQGSGFRTNLVATDLSGSGSELEFVLPDSVAAPTPLRVSVPANGQVQVNGLAAAAGADASDVRASRLIPVSGSIMAGLIAIDDVTNDPSWFGPDLPARNRMIPSIVHADGANGASFRTDLYLFNPDVESRDISLGSAGRSITIKLAPAEFRVIPDALWTLFGSTGAARLGIYTTGVRITSPTYTINSDGSTYGTVIPPLDSLQVAGPGETLEILGPVGGPTFRTNLSLVSSSPAHIEILDESGALVDQFDTPAPISGFVQVNDIFRTRGLGSGPSAALIRVTPIAQASAYATTIDNGTNDAVYFAGALGSH